MEKRAKYIVTIVCLLAGAVVMALCRGLFEASGAKTVFGILSDCFFVPGLLAFGIGAIGWAASKGTYDMLRFGSGRAVRWIIPGMDKEKYDDFYEYKTRQDEKGRKWPKHMLICGGGALLLALIMNILYAVL